MINEYIRYFLGVPESFKTTFYPRYILPWPKDRKVFQKGRPATVPGSRVAKSYSRYLAGKNRI